MKNKSRMTLAAAKAVVNAHGCKLRRTAAGDYRVNIAGGTEATAYYTDDLADAVETAASMQRAIAHASQLSRVSSWLDECYGVDA